MSHPSKCEIHNVFLRRRSLSKKSPRPIAREKRVVVTRQRGAKYAHSGRLLAGNQRNSGLRSLLEAYHSAITAGQLGFQVPDGIGAGDCMHFKLSCSSTAHVQFDELGWN